MVNASKPKNEKIEASVNVHRSLYLKPPFHQKEYYTIIVIVSAVYLPDNSYCSNKSNNLYPFLSQKIEISLEIYLP